MDANEYLEKIAAESYKREVDQEENVVRSLPFVVAAMALLVTILGFAKIYIPVYSINFYPIFVFSILLGVGVSVGISILFLFLTVIPREFRYLSRTSDLQEYARSLRDYYSQLHDVDDIDKSVVEDIRILMIEQYAIGTTYSQTMNNNRYGARAKAFTSLVVALALAFVFLATISIHEIVEGTRQRGTVIEGD